ncbi:acyl-CoA dehydrogenase family protein [Candidatus Uabimicrobium amorphum]|uniref:Acyl-CoA dehydrogenase n=1 Tax=Uabimicrobium amorphum TaxID=2596890 RepID=A0A5S9IRH5_UABAM|nr:acyl-CoA dehydrogenase family protein [Candidatus Uabimicrobium amorphum]BBM86111.1 acyl-CoA dehydrogenase [Candidatus Uabimicrobium amorphum]
MPATLDLYKMYETLTTEEQQIWQAAQNFVDKEFMPIISAHHRDATFPVELIPKLGKLGFLGSQLPEEYGCAGINNRAYGLIMQELERGDSALRSVASVQGALVMYPIWRYGSQQQKEHWLPQLAAGEKVGCFGLTEPDFGSNPAGMLTNAKPHKDGFLLNGSKMWITNGNIADVAVVWAKLDGKVHGFLVPKDTPGFTATEIKGKFSLRASITSELSFNDCFIPKENMLPEAQGLKAPLSCLSQARYGIAWGAIGSALATYHCALDYSKTRIQFDKPIASFQLIQQQLVEMASDITHAQLLAFRLAELKDQKQVRPAMISLAKRNNVRMALNTARTARNILAANGIVDEYPIMRHMMNLETVITYEGTHEVHTLILGQHLTGVSAFE